MPSHRAYVSREYRNRKSSYAGRVTHRTVDNYAGHTLSCRLRGEQFANDGPGAGTSVHDQDIVRLSVRQAPYNGKKVAAAGNWTGQADNPALVLDWPDKRVEHTKRFVNVTN
jgi:hypothetical protein